MVTYVLKGQTELRRLYVQDIIIVRTVFKKHAQMELILILLGHQLWANVSSALQASIVQLGMSIYRNVQQVQYVGKDFHKLQKQLSVLKETIVLKAVMYKQNATLVLLIIQKGKHLALNAQQASIAKILE